MTIRSEMRKNEDKIIVLRMIEGTQNLMPDNILGTSII